jgi:glutamate carboxypeptidase
MTAVSHRALEASRHVSECVDKDLEGYLAVLERAVNTDSGPDSPDGIRHVETIFAERFERLGASVQWREANGVDHFCACFTGGEASVIMLGHADTVFRRGTAKLRPFATADGRALGPGVADMKGGLVVALAALECLAVEHYRPSVHVVIVGDEEVRLTPPPFLDLLQADACLVLECGRAAGGFVVGRKAGMWLNVSVVGRAAHVGTESELGRNAIVSLCNEVLRISALHNAREGLTVTVAVVEGGSARNAVPDRGRALIDVRALRSSDLDWALAQMRAPNGAPAGIRTVVEREGAWPAMSPDASLTLAQAYEELARAASVVSRAEVSGGMSDGCWTAAAGIPTIDGIGPVGGLDHGPDEFIEVQSIPARAGLLAGLLVEIEQRKREQGERGEGRA